MKRRKVDIIKNQRIIISASARKGFLSPKKRKLHATFKRSWIPKKKIARFFISGKTSLLIQTIKRDKPIRRYKKVQTGANIHPGGLKKGFLRRGYQVFTDE